MGHLTSISSKQDFPFAFAFTTALIIHVAVVFVLRTNLRRPAPSQLPRKQPVTMRFIEVPSQARTIPQQPKTEYYSDANRKAGTIEAPKNEQQPSKRGTSRRAQMQMQRPSAGSPRSAARNPAPAVTESSDANAIASTQVPGGSGSSQPAVPGLAKSLKNLDQFIEGGGGTQQSGGVTPDLGSGVYFDTQGYDLGPWANRVVGIVKSNWLIPLAAQMGARGVVSVGFKIDRQGRLFDIQVAESSKLQAFDQAAVNAVRSSNPLPPLPADFPRPHLPAVFRFYYNIPVP